MATPWEIFSDSDASDASDDDAHHSSASPAAPAALSYGGLPQLRDDNLLATILAIASDPLALMRQRAASVCRRFRHVLLHERACWQELFLAPPSVPGRIITDSLVCGIVQTHGDQLRFVRLPNARRLGSATVTALALNCPQLRGVTLTGCAGVGGGAVRLLCQRCPDLEECRVAGINMASSAASSSDARDGNGGGDGAKGGGASEGAGAGGSGDEDRGGGGGGDGGRALPWTPGATSLLPWSGGAADEIVHTMAAQCPSLRSMSMSSLQTDESLVALLSGCPALTALDLASCDDLPCSDQLLAALAGRQGQLESLKVRERERWEAGRGAVRVRVRARVWVWGGG